MNYLRQSLSIGYWEKALFENQERLDSIFLKAFVSGPTRKADQGESGIEDILVCFE